MARRSSHHKLNSDVSTWLGLGSGDKQWPFTDPARRLWWLLLPEQVLLPLLASSLRLKDWWIFSKLARKNGLILMWDYTCKHTLAASNVLGCSKEAGSAAIAAEEIKRKKYSELAKENHYIPIAQETLVIVRSDEFNDRGKVGIKARSPQTSPWTKKIHLMFIKITLPNIGRRPRVIACFLIINYY